MSTPILTQSNLKERGFETSVMICPKCKDKWEEVDGYPRLTCAYCNAEPIWWPEYQKTLKCAEIDLMPPFVLAIHIEHIIRAMRGEDRPTIANFLEERLALMRIALYGIEKSSPV